MGHPSRMQFGPFLIDIGERVLRRDGQPVPLTPKAFDLLAALLERPGQLISKEELLQKVWPDTFVEESNLAYNVFALRKALGDAAENSSYIETVPKKGYRFAAVARPVVTAVRASVSSDAENTVLLFHKASVRSQAAVELKPALEELPAETSPGPREVQPPRRFSLPRWVWIAAVMVLAVAAFLAARSWREPAAEPLRAVPLTSLPGVVRSPSLSSDGNYVVFSWNGPKQDNPDIYVQQIGVSAPPLRLTSDPSNDYGPSWSPDGRTIAFLRRGPAGGKSDVWRIAPLGGFEHKVAEIQPRLAPFRPTSLGWCPDSTCLVLTDSLGDGKPDAVFAISVETSERRQLTYPEGLVMDADPAISPDGRSLVFRRDGTPFTGEFYRVSLNREQVPEGDPVRLTSTLVAGKPVWIPDTREILFSARGGIWRLDAFAGGTPTRLPFVGQDGTTPVVARSLGGGQRLVYVRSFVDTNVWRIDTPAPGARAGSPPAVAIASTRGDTLPNLAPDGHRLVFLSNRSDDFEFWITDLDGSNAVRLTSMGILPGYAKWSPDGELIAFHGDPEGRPDVLVVPSRGGQPRIITKGTAGGAYPSFSRDGRWIYFSAGLDKGQQRIWKMPVSGGAPVQVTNNKASIAIESYDRDLYYVDAADRPGTIWRLPTAGGAPVKVVEGVVLGNFDVVEDGIYYIDRAAPEAGAFFTDRPGGETRLRYLDFSTSQSTTVVDNLGTVGFGLTVSRDGRTVFFSRVDSSIDELIVVENFR